ncbi:MAG: hypothetical protein N2235_02505 [Fischerella sp.]|nr:hypothetical protein [Fischerella sp.]
MFTIGGTGILVHKYLGPDTTGNTGDDATQPVYNTDDPLNIQDVLWGENRDRKYEPDVYPMRGVYQRTDQDFDLSQFGLFLANGTVFMTWHLNDMIAQLGRRIIPGDVIEFMHLEDKDFLGAEESPATLKKFYVVQEVSWAAEGFAQTWWPHLWRGKLIPMPNSQEYKSILDNVAASDPEGTGEGGPPPSLSDVLNNLRPIQQINDKIIEQAERDVPKSGYDTSKLYVKPVDAQGNLLPENTPPLTDFLSPSPAYLNGDGLAPNGFPVLSGTTFPENPNVGDYVLRLDYLPNRLFRFDGRRWVKVEDSVRTSMTPGPTNQTQRSVFVNNTNTYVKSTGETMPERQSLSKALKPTPDNN